MVVGKDGTLTLPPDLLEEFPPGSLATASRTEDGVLPRRVNPGTLRAGGGDVSLLQAEGLRFERGGRVIFEGVSLSVQPGDRLAVTGPSGSGKTSLLSVLAGLAPPAAGTVRRDGVPVAAGTLPADTAAVLQGYGLVSLLTAAENVEILLRAGGMPAREAMAAARTAPAGLGLGDFGDHLVQELSGGQQQRVPVARALAARPQLLIADEPTAEQDAATRELVLAQLLSVVADGGALVLATHDPEVVSRCDHVVSLARHLTERHGARVAAPLPLLPPQSGRPAGTMSHRAGYNRPNVPSCRIDRVPGRGGC